MTPRDFFLAVLMYEIERYRRFIMPYWERERMRYDWKRDIFGIGEQP